MLKLLSMIQKLNLVGMWLKMCLCLFVTAYCGNDLVLLCVHCVSEMLNMYVLCVCVPVSNAYHNMRSICVFIDRIGSFCIRISE